MDRIHFTICSRNYLAFALVLGRSLMSVQPGSRFVIFLADGDVSDTVRSKIEFDVISVQNL